MELLLCNPDIDINLQDQWGGTALFVSLEGQRLSTVVMRFIKAGCDVKIADKTKITPLHLAMASSSNGIALELIKRGAAINAHQEHVHIPGCFGITCFEKDQVKEKTPLDDAVGRNNLEGVCMLLYYGANIYIVNYCSMTPLKYAAYKNQQDIVEILSNYYDESYCNYLLATSIKQYIYSTADWLKRLYLILKNFRTQQFTITYKYSRTRFSSDTFFSNLFGKFRAGNIQATTRVGITYICLSLCAPVVFIDDFEQAHKCFGFGEELEALIYYNLYENGGKSGTFITFILTMEEDFSSKVMCELFQSYFWTSFCSKDYVQLRIGVDYFVSLFRYFSLPAKVKQFIKNLCGHISSNDKRRIFEDLNQIPEFPTLLELSRNQARKYIKQTYEVRYPYHFYDAVKKLIVPQSIKDLICMKTPLY